MNNKTHLGLTPFWTQVLAAEAGQLATPEVISQSGGKVPFHYYQAVNHKSALRLMSVGMTVRGLTLRALRQHYGITGTAKTMYAQICEIVEKYAEGYRPEAERTDG